MIASSMNFFTKLFTVDAAHHFVPVDTTATSASETYSPLQNTRYLFYLIFLKNILFFLLLYMIENYYLYILMKCINSDEVENSYTIESETKNARNLSAVEKAFESSQIKIRRLSNAATTNTKNNSEISYTSIPPIEMNDDLESNTTIDNNTNNTIEDNNTTNDKSNSSSNSGGGNKNGHSFTYKESSVKQTKDFGLSTIDSYLGIGKS